MVLDEEKDQAWKQDASAACENVESEIRRGRGVGGQRKDSQSEVEQEDGYLGSVSVI